MITQQDLVEWQIRVAAGQPLPIMKQSHVPLIGHSIEARIYAEDPDQDFLPQSGTIEVLRTPTEVEEELRIDTGFVQGDTVSTYYDPMISKLIVHADDRETAINAMDHALRDYKVIGLPTNIKFLKRALKLDDFKSGQFDTGIIEKNKDELMRSTKKYSHTRLGTMAIVQIFLESLKMRLRRTHAIDPWTQRDMWRVNHTGQRELTMVNDETGEREIIVVEYVHENVFNAFLKD